MPTAYGGRMSKRLSQAPRLSVIMAGDEVIERKTSVKEFLCDHVKTIATLVMIFATILCIVLIVMVHKWKYENEQAARIEACLDVAVVGSGISGAYAAWKLRNNGLQVALLEMTDRIGGRMHTWHPPPDPNFLSEGLVHGELGALFYLPQQHPLLNRTIHALRLTPVEFRPPNQDPPIRYLRGKVLTNKELSTLGEKMPYHLLSPSEQGRKPQDLKTFYLEKVLANGTNLQTSALNAKDRDGRYLYTQGYWNLLSRVASSEGVDFLQDTAPWRSFSSNGNAAILASITLEPNVDHMTVREGMQAIPEKLVQEFLNASSDHVLHTNKRLGCITKERGFYDMIFINTETKFDNTTDLRNSTDICAKKIIVALPPPALKKVDWKKFSPDQDDANDEDGKFLQERLDSLETIPSVVAYFVYNKKWWKEYREPWVQDVLTDLPINRVRYLGERRLNPEMDQRAQFSPEYDTQQAGKHLFMVANLDGSDYEYFSSLITTTSYDGFLKLSCNKNTNLVRDVTRQLATIYGVKAKDIPEPESLHIVDWSRTPSGGGRFMWKTGVYWDRVASELLKPRPKEKIFVVGDAYCPGQCQLWAEGALQTVDTVFSDYAEHFFSEIIHDSYR